jgi:hypothetical protein
MDFLPLLTVEPIFWEFLDEPFEIAPSVKSHTGTGTRNAACTRRSESRRPFYLTGFCGQTAAYKSRKGRHVGTASTPHEADIRVVILPRSAPPRR